METHALADIRLDHRRGEVDGKAVVGSLQTFVTVHSSVYNPFNLRRHPCLRDHFTLNRAAALAQWRQLGAA